MSLCCLFDDIPTAAAILIAIAVLIGTWAWLKYQNQEEPQKTTITSKNADELRSAPNRPEECLSTAPKSSDTTELLSAAPMSSDTLEELPSAAPISPADDDVIEVLATKAYSDKENVKYGRDESVAESVEEPISLETVNRSGDRGNEKYLDKLGPDTTLPSETTDNMLPSADQPSPLMFSPSDPVDFSDLVKLAAEEPAAGNSCGDNDNVKNGKEIDDELMEEPISLETVNRSGDRGNEKYLDKLGPDTTLPSEIVDKLQPGTTLPSETTDKLGQDTTLPSETGDKLGQDTSVPADVVKVAFMTGQEDKKGDPTTGHEH